MYENLWSRRLSFLWRVNEELGVQILVGHCLKGWGRGLS